MFISVEDEDKLKIVKDYKPRELSIILHFLECGMFHDKLGRPYSRNALNELYEHSVRGDFWRDSNGQR